MGMYTELVLNLDLKGDTPKEVISVIESLCTFNDRKKWPEHRFFRLQGFRNVLNCCSYSHSGTYYRRFVYDECVGVWHLSSRSSFKNYSNEIYWFINWLRAYIETTGMIGYSRYEDCAPFIIYMSPDGKEVTHLGT